MPYSTMRNRWNLNLFGNYTLGWSRNDTDGPFLQSYTEHTIAKHL